MSDTLRTLYERFDPEGALRKDEWRAARPRSKTSSLLKRLEMGIGEGKFLLVGTVGTGKSTELLRIAEARQDTDFVVQLDLVEHFEHVVGDLAALQSVESWEVLFLALLAVARKAQLESIENVLGSLGDFEAAWTRTARRAEVPEAEQTSLDIRKLLSSMAVVGATAKFGPLGGALARGASSAVEVGWKLPLGKSRKPLDDQEQAVQSLLQAANVILGNIQQQTGRRVLLVLDGLDRIEDKDVARRVFGHSALLSRLECRSVICGPFVLRHSTELTGVRGFDIEVLVNEPVLDFDEPEKRGPGIVVMQEAFAKRTQDLDFELDPTILDELAYRSGGRMRDFVKLVRELAAQTLLANATFPRTEHLNEALKRQRLLLEAGLDVSRLDLLREVMGDKQRRLPSGDVVYELLRTSRLLPYPDGSEWYYPHTLLLRGRLLG
ncbi:MAG: hypothetical protein AB8I08_39475 [Sandaracinaceae bacterium]